MKRVIIESPYAGDISRHIDYLRLCMADSLRRGEAPYASHGLYTQPGVLDDTVPEERALGIEAGFVWRNVAEASVIYVDMGMSSGMRAGIKHALDMGHPITVRALGLGKVEAVDLEGEAAIAYLFRNRLYPGPLESPPPFDPDMAEALNERLVVIGGPSGAGKSTVCCVIEQRGIRRLVGGTSRPPRKGEVGREDYFFGMIFSIARIIAIDEALGWTFYDDALYAYMRRDIEDAARAPWSSVIDLTPPGLRDLRAAGLDPVSVWLDAPDDVLRARLEARGDSPDTIARRMAQAEQMRAEAKRLGYTVTIDTSTLSPIDVVDEVQAVIDAVAREGADTLVSSA